MLNPLLPLKILNLKAFRTFGFGLQGHPMPINFTVSVTNKCNARCKTCNIWRIYEEQPDLSKSELSAEEFERIFESIGRNAYWFTLSGGEPFLRKDIVRIYDALVRHCSPNIVNIPSNAVTPKLIEKRVREILQINNNNNNKPTLIVNLSLDGVDSLHDEIRGVKGNFENFMNTFERLTVLKADFENLRVGVHTVVSIYNIEHLEDIYDFVRELNPKPDSHIFEVAEERVELDTIGTRITPDHRSFSKAFTPLREEIKSDYLKGDFLSRITQSFRLEYYEMVEKILKERRQLIPCYAGFASCQISPYGDVWACCVLAKSLGNLRDTNFEFYKVWHSEKANEIRASIKRGECYCPLANATYTSMFCNFYTMKRVLYRILRCSR